MADLSFSGRMRTAMAESKGKQVANGHPGKPPKQNKLLAVIESVRQLSNSPADVQYFADSLDGKERLEERLRDQIIENDKLRNKNQETLKMLRQFEADRSQERSCMTSAFGERYKEFEKTKSEIEHITKERNGLSVKLEESEAANKKLEAQLLASQAERKNMAGQLLVMERDTKYATSRLAAAQAEIDMLSVDVANAQENLGSELLQDESTASLAQLRKEMRFISEACHKLAIKFFHGQPCNTSVRVPNALQRLRHLFPEIPLSSADTNEASLMRCAAGEAVLCGALMKHIFRPFYMPVDLISSAENILDWFADNVRLQAIYRCQILKSLGNETGGQIEDAKVSAMDKFHDEFGVLVPTIHAEAFNLELEALFKRAASLWLSKVQVAKHLLDISLENTHRGIEVSYPEYGPRGTSSQGQGTGSVAVHLFPAISSKEEIIHPGAVLYWDQKVLCEAREQVAHVPDRQHGSTKRRSSYRASNGHGTTGEDAR